MMKTICRIVLVVAVCAAPVPASRVAGAQAAAGATLEETVPPGNNFDKAEFKLWYPKDAGPLQAVLVLVPAYPTAWLPTLRVARAWQAMVTEKPFDAQP